MNCPLCQKAIGMRYAPHPYCSVRCYSDAKELYRYERRRRWRERLKRFLPWLLRPS